MKKVKKSTTSLIVVVLIASLIITLFPLTANAASPVKDGKIVFRYYGVDGLDNLSCTKTYDKNKYKIVGRSCSKSWLSTKINERTPHKVTIKAAKYGGKKRTGYVYITVQNKKTKKKTKIKYTCIEYGSSYK